MTTRTSRKVAALALVAATAFGVTACTPPNQKDSAQKVDTATSQNPNSLPDAGQTGGTATATATNVTDANASAQATTTAERAAANAAADGTPLFINCETEAEHKPGTIILNCKDKNDIAENITWDEWTDEIAHGTATRNIKDVDRVVNDAQITLSAPEVVNGALVFTQVSIDGASVQTQTTY
ncbi:hypothetical protein QYQ98_09380 [Corynebacterium sp. P3-F1]|uniref:hypothetical protein n=1 Tax=Corynebacterium sp. P3-F1 TaxID=3059080 RepID=UPI00265D2560|nr:hypothetical protein [Corynebacterium sp. P3-F1]WKK61216.1 hypothetical protein QYQ98_09380 [Corynebacterium sp. P3-F1]